MDGDEVGHDRLELRLITRGLMHEDTLQDMELNFMQHVEALHAEVEVLLFQKAPCSTREPGLRRPTPPALASGPT